MSARTWLEIDSETGEIVVTDGPRVAFATSEQIAEAFKAEREHVRILREALGGLIESMDDPSLRSDSLIHVARRALSLTDAREGAL